jgi:hypothetical protein
MGLQGFSYLSQNLPWDGKFHLKIRLGYGIPYELRTHGGTGIPVSYQSFPFFLALVHAPSEEKESENHQKASDR